MDRILCIEDGESDRAIIESTLGRPRVTFASTMKEAGEFISDSEYALVILDIELPDGNGLELIPALTDQLHGVPVILLTQHRDFASKASAFSLGADDYIVKPFDPRELKLRVEAKLRKTAAVIKEKATVRIGSLVCQIQEQRLFIDGNKRPVDLTSFEVRIFHLLASAPNKIFTRAEILDRVWGDSISVTERAVDVHVSNLRKKLAGSHVTIEGVIGTGYRIVVEKTGLAV